MGTLPVGNQAPAVEGIAQDGSVVRLADYFGKQAVVLFFYPLDFSPTCTAEVCAFRDAYTEFAEAGAVVIGISGDSVERHRAFATRQDLPYVLLSDADGAIRRAFGVGKTLGIFPERVTFVIDKAGTVRSVFRQQFGAQSHRREALEVVQRLRAEEKAVAALPDV